MGLDYGYISVLKKEYVPKALEFIHTHAQWDGGEYAILEVEVDAPIKQYLRQQEGFIAVLLKKNIHYRLTKEGKALIDTVMIHQQEALISNEYVELRFYATTTKLSTLFQDSVAIAQWFLSFSQAANVHLTYADLEDQGCKIVYWKGKPVSIFLQGDRYLEHSKQEFLEIIQFFADSDRPLNQDWS